MFDLYQDEPTVETAPASVTAEAQEPAAVAVAETVS
jgi:hypothetical protein